MNIRLSVIPLAAAAIIISCAPNRSPDVTGKISDSLKQAGLTDVNVSQDRSKGVVTLSGSVPQEADKARAEQIASPLAAGQVIANEIAVGPEGSASRAAGTDMDKGIDNNLDAALKQANIQGVHHSVKNGVVTLKGTVPTEEMRTNAATLASSVPNVSQVVNEIEVKGQPAQPATTPSGPPNQ